MKSTDMARRDREIRRSQKKQELISKRRDKKKGMTIGDYINNLHSLFFYDEKKIYNAQNSEEILALLEDMKKDLPEEQWENVLRKAIRKTQVKAKEQAFNDLISLLTEK